MKEKKERLKPLSLYGYDLKEAIRAILSVDPRKTKLREGIQATQKEGTLPGKEDETGIGSLA